MNPMRDDFVTKEEFRATNQKILKRLDEVATKKELESVKQDVNHIKNDFTGLKEDVTLLKEDVTLLKEDVAGLREDVSGLKGDMSSLKENVADNTATINRLISRVIENEQKMVTRDEFEEAMNRIFIGQDKIIGMFETSRLEMKVQDSVTSRLKEEVENEKDRNDAQDQIIARHNQRITKLEVAIEN